MLKPVPLLCLFTLLFCGCGQTRYVKDILCEADSLMMLQPDSALRLLDGIDPHTLPTRATKARYALQRSQALDKCRIDMTSDSVIAPAVAFYASRGSNRDRAYTNYYLGRIRNNAGDVGEAAQLMLKAERYAIAAKETYLLGQIYNCRGLLYFSQYSLDETARMYELADSCCTKAGNRPAAALMARLKAKVYTMTHDFPAAEREIKKALIVFDSVGDKQQARLSATMYAAVLRHMGVGADSLKRFLLTTYDRYTNGIKPASDNAFWVWIYLQQNKPDSARYFSNLALKTNTTGNRLSGMLAIRGEVEAACGNYKEAARLWKRVSERSDSIAQEDKTELVQRVEAIYKNKELKHTNEILRLRNKLVVTIALLAITLGIFGFLLILRHRRAVIRRKSDEIARYRTFIDKLNDEYNELQIRHFQLVHERNSDSPDTTDLLPLLENRLSELKQLLDTAYSGGCKPEAFYKAFKEYAAGLNSSDGSFSDLHYIVNRRHNGILDYLRKEYPSLTALEINMLSMMIFGFSLDSIRLIFNHDNIDSIYSRRTKIREKLDLPPRFGLEKYLEELKVSLKDAGVPKKSVSA